MITHTSPYKETERIARRSYFHRHRTGAMIFKGSKVISNGWSHVPNGGTQLRSLHAEMHALARGRYADLDGCTMYIVTLTRAGYYTLAQPCLHCAIALAATGIDKVYYTTGRYTTKCVNPDELLDRIKTLKVYNGNNS